MDIIIKNNLSKEEIRNMLSQVFQVEERQVLVKNNIFEIEHEKDVKILCEPYHIDWNFKTRLEIYAKGLNETKEELINIVSKICEILKCEVLIDDGTKNPFTMLKIQKISVDIDKFDEAEEYDDNN